MTPPPSTIAEALELVAERQPTAPALCAPGRRILTCAELSAQIRHVRERLGGFGIGPGDVVVGVVPSRPEMAAAVASLTASATFAPLGPSLVDDAYAELIGRLRPKAVLLPRGVDHPLRTAAERHGIAEIDLTTEPDAPAGRFTLDLLRARRSLDGARSLRPEVAFVFMSSGTTGRPKLVPMAHRQALIQASSVIDRLELSPRDVSCHLVPLHLAGGVLMSFLNLLLGGASVVCLPEADVPAFFAAIGEFRPTVLFAGFAVQRAILRQAPDHQDAVRESAFRFLRAATGRLEPEEIERLEQTFETPMLIGYSTTETIAIALDPLPPRPRKRSAVGLPLANEVAIRDESGRFLPRGSAGEIVVRGPTVFGGYLDDPALTAASFDGEWFRTGDVGCVDDDGYVHISGRIKEIINRGGDKVSPLEIDAALTSLAGVREAATFGIPHPSLGEEVVAAVVREAHAAIEPAQVLDHVRTRVGARKAPRRIYFVERIPRTDAGKVRRGELARLLGVDAGLREAKREAPLSPLEGALAGLWMSILGVSHVGRDDDFFLLGGDSLHGMQLVGQVRALFGVELTVQSLFAEAATVAGMATAIEGLRGRRTGPVMDVAARESPIPRRQTRGPAALSHMQRRAWFLARLAPGQSAYNETRAYRLAGALDVEALRASLHALVQRQEILRTTYALVGDEPRQVVHEDATVDPRLVDLTSLPESERDEALQVVLAAEAEEPFDLEAGPVLRVTVIRLADREHVLQRTWHHIGTDAWSGQVFDRDISSAYNAVVAGRLPQLPVLPLQYADYATWQREQLTGRVLDEQLAYWTARLASLPTLLLPTDHPRPATQSHRGARLEIALPRELTEAVRAIGRADGATPFMTFLAAFQVLLHRYSGSDDVPVGIPIAARSHAELEDLIGFFANTLVLRTDLSGEPTFHEVLARVREAAVGAYSHSEVPFEKLVEVLAPPRDPSRNPLFQVCFALQNAPDDVLALDGLEASPLPLPTSHAKFDLYVTVRETAEGPQARWEYSTDLFERRTVERMAAHFRVLLESIAAEPDQHIGHLALVTAAERHRLLAEWSSAPAGFPGDACVHRLFEARAARTPAAVAVVHEGATLTYAELDARANQVAHHLRANGVEPQALVGICMERHPLLIVGLLGILKAGAVYVPLDPELPAEQLRFMLDDTAPKVVVTQERLLGRLPPMAVHPPDSPRA